MVEDAEVSVSASRPGARPRKVLHLIATNFYGGPERQIVSHLRRLDPARFSGMLVSFIERGAGNEILAVAGKHRIPCAGVPMASPLDASAVVTLRRRIGAEKADLVCAHGYKSVVMACVAGVGLGVPILAYSRGYTAESARVAFYERLERMMLRFVDGIVCVSEGQRRKLASFGIERKRTWVVHNAVSVEDQPRCLTDGEKAELKRALGVLPASRLVVSAGRLSPEKGHRFLVEAIPAVVERIPDVVFMFCGEGRCRVDLEDLATRLGVASRCRFPGFRRDMREIFRAMDLMVLPSLSEGLPNVVLEAFAAGKPVVATSVGGVPEIVEDGVSGLLAPSGDPEALADATIRALASGADASAMGRAGRDRVRRDFTFERQNALLEGIYDDLVSGAGR